MLEIRRSDENNCYQSPLGEIPLVTQEQEVAANYNLTMSVIEISE